MNPVCREHPAVDAHYRCDDCGRPLCDECVELASRLAVCLPCGGLARPLPVGDERPAGPGTPRSGAAPDATPRPLAEILAWPLLGIQGLALAACALLLAIPVAAEILVPPAACVLVFPRLLVGLVIPGLMADVARASAEGLPGLPEWPSYPTGRLGEIVRFVGAGFLALLPAGLLLGLTGCVVEAVAAERIGPACHLLLLAGLWIGAFVWLPLYVATLLRGGFWVLFDFADHARTIGRHAPELARAATLCAVPLVLATSARTFFPVHVVGGVLETVLALYGAVLGAHVAGSFLGRHRDELESLYLERVGG